jgi:2-polyprenyl-6-methoxyphenol hydroxylase-like FAD-dependent oxidoreductase
LQARFAGYAREIVELLAQVEPEALTRTDISDFKPLRSWHRGRVVLVGDAAHATTPNLGQGACQAIESAWVLAQELSRRLPADAFAAFAAARMAKAHFITRAWWRFGQISNLRGPLVASSAIPSSRARRRGRSRSRWTGFSASDSD